MKIGTLIVGGGPAGAALAIGLARTRLPHLLVERSRETGDALCGGFLSWRTLDRLASLGIAADALNPVRVTQARLFAGGREAHAALPRPALAVSRRRLDTLLLARDPIGWGRTDDMLTDGNLRRARALAERIGDSAERAVSERRVA